MIVLKKNKGQVTISVYISYSWEDRFLVNGVIR